jgi:dihydropyrimidinase
MPIDRILAGGTVVTAETTFEGSVAIDDGTIVAVGDEESLPDADDRVDVSGQLLMPGVVDPHVHIDERFSLDSHETATAAAALGGITTCIAFGWQSAPDDAPPDRTLLDGIERKKAEAADALVDVSYHGTIWRTDTPVLDEIEDAVEAGITSFKLFTAYEVGVENGFLDRAFERIAETDAVAVVHTEDDSVCTAITEEFKTDGKGDPEWYPQSRPDYAEAMAAEDAVRMATEAGCRYYGFHTTCRKAADVLAAFRRAHPDLVRAETCTHYTTNDDSIYEELGNLPMLAPPIRKPDDVEAMFEYLDDGALDVVSTDHCAYTRESKQTDNWWESSFGANSLQVSLPVFHDEAVVERGRSYPYLVRKMCRNPARLFGLPRKGTLDPGTDADVVVFDPSAEQTISAEDNASKADFSIYEGRTVDGAVSKTFVRGELVADDGEIVADPGHGTFVERTVPDW